MNLKFVKGVLNFFIGVFRPILLEEIFILGFKYIFCSSLVFWNLVEHRFRYKNDRPYKSKNAFLQLSDCMTLPDCQKPRLGYGLNRAEQDVTAAELSHINLQKELFVSLTIECFSLEGLNFVRIGH